MEDLTDDELQRYNRLMEAHFVAVLEDRRNFKIENLIGHRRGPYYTFVVVYRENLGGMRWRGKEEILVWFKGETVVYTDLKPSLLNIKYRKPPDPRPVYQKPSP